MINEDSARQHRPFDHDVEQSGAYQYTAGDRYSARTANARLTDLTVASLDMRTMRVLDVGCGDGTYTFELFERGKPRAIHGVDLSAAAIAVASAKSPSSAVTFSTCSGSSLQFPNDSFDIVHLRGVLHHMDQPAIGVAEALRVAPKVFIIEPNGWNPILKIIEKLSKYHREHDERSFSPARIESWCAAHDGQIVWRSWAGLVPFFCPDSLARCFKLLEPLVERLPVARHLGCAVFAVMAERPPVRE